MMERCGHAAEELLERVLRWLEARGVARGAGMTELELAAEAEKRLGVRGLARFLETYYLPAVYGSGPEAPAEEAARGFVDSLCGPAPQEGGEEARTDGPAEAEAGAGAGTPGPLRCRRCGRPVEAREE